jgi:hypothetical protein
MTTGMQRLNLFWRYGIAAVSFIVYMSWASVSVGQSQPSWEEILRRYEEAMSRVRTVDVQYEMVSSRDSDPTPVESRSQVRWSHESANRCRVSIQGQVRDGKSTFRLAADHLLMADKVYDYRNAEVVSGASDRPEIPQIRGSIWPIKSATDRQKAHQGVAMHINSFIAQVIYKHESLSEPRRTLREMLRESERKFGSHAVQVSQEMVQDALCWKISYRHPGGVFQGRAFSGDMRQSLYFDPAANYLIRKEEDQGKAFPDDVCEYHNVAEVTKIKNCGDGIFFPEEIDYSDGGTSRWTLTVRVTSVTINQPIPEDRWDFRFPEGILVQEGSSFPGQGEQLRDASQDRIHVVGANGKFVQSFLLGSAEFQNYTAAMLKQHQRQLTHQRTRIALSAGGILLLVLVCGVVWTLRRGRTSTAGPMNHVPR